MRQANISHGRDSTRQGFTLIEVLTVIVIIGILAALVVPAIAGAVRRAKEVAIAMEIDSLSQAIETYNTQYGDYPPDFSDVSTVERHYRRIFPQIAASDLTALSTAMGGSPVGIDRAEALVFTLGGYSSNKQHPLTGSGGPLVVSGGTVTYNTDRANAIFPFELGRLNSSNFEAVADSFPTFAPSGKLQPYVYFDSRTYNTVATASTIVANGYIGGGEAGGIRPYKTMLTPRAPTGATYGSAIAAANAFKFHKADTFQIISAGLDDIYGFLIFADSNTSGLPINYISETGVPVVPEASAANPMATRFGTINGFQESELSPQNVNGHLDNITNFSEGTLENSLQEL